MNIFHKLECRNIQIVIVSRQNIVLTCEDVEISKNIALYVIELLLMDTNCRAYTSQNILCLVMVIQDYSDKYYSQYSVTRCKETFK